MKNNRYVFAVFLAPIVLGPAKPAMAKENETIVVTATGIEQDIETTGTSIAVISEEKIENQQSLSVAALLQEVPGVNIVQSGGLGAQTSVRIRGAENDQTLVLINGIRVNDPSTPDGSFDFGNLFAGNIERIEVLRGANSVSWGSQAIGGVVNVITKRPSDNFELFAQGEYGANDTIRVLSNASGTLGPIGLSMGGGYVKTDGISAFSGGTEADGYRQYSANASLSADLASNIRIEASGYYVDSRVDNDSVFPPFSFETTQFSLAKEFYGHIALLADAFDERLQNRFAFSIADINRDIINPSPSFTSLPRGRTERFEYRGNFAVSDGLRLIFGTELEDSFYKNAEVSDSTGIDSLFLQAVTKPVSGLTMTGGLRYDEHDDFGGNTSLAGNIVYKTSSKGPILRAAYAEGFRAPSLIDLDDRPFGFGTPGLLPETAESYEVGIEQDFVDRAVGVSLTLFQRNTRNQIAFTTCPSPPDPAPAVCLSGNRPFGTTLNIESNRTRGVEATLSVHPAEGFHIAANYTYLDTENRSAGANFGNKLARRPSNSFYLNVSYEPSPGLQLAADMQIVGDSFDDLANNRRIDGYALAGVRAELPIAEEITLFGRIDNLFDVNYETATDFGTFGRSAYIGARARF